MKKYNKTLLALMLCAVTVLGASGISEARPGGHRGYHHGNGQGYGGGMGYGPQMTPEMQQMVNENCNKMAPVRLELQAKQAELTAKIYSGADDNTIQALSRDVSRLQAQLTESRVAAQKQYAKAGVPMRGGMRGMGHGMGAGCPMGYHHGQGMGYGMGYGAQAPAAAAE